ncbi:putative reverse transcriptase domain-containing protein [Tanacetum coccineum]
MITTNNIIEGKKLLRLMLSPQLRTIGHLTKNCRNKGPATGSNLKPILVTCHAYGEKGHYRNQCPKANNNAHGRAYLLRDKNAQVLFDSGANKSFVSISQAPQAPQVVP